MLTMCPKKDPHGVARDSGEPEHEHQTQIEAVDPRPRMAQGALGEVQPHADGLQERRGLLHLMLNEITILELRQNAVESELAGGEVGRCDVRIIHVGGANHDALAKFWCRALLFEKKGPKAHSFAPGPHAIGQRALAKPEAPRPSHRQPDVHREH